MGRLGFHARTAPNSYRFPPVTGPDLKQRVITQLYHPVMSVPGATIRAMPDDLEQLPAPVSPSAPGAGPTMLAGELVHRVRAELPVVSELGELVAAASLATPQAWRTLRG
jgi:hypothetical protein